jgi:hypothetical protein
VNTGCQLGDVEAVCDFGGRLILRVVDAPEVEPVGVEKVPDKRGYSRAAQWITGFAEADVIADPVEHLEFFQRVSRMLELTYVGQYRSARGGNSFDLGDIDFFESRFVLRRIYKSNGPARHLERDPHPAVARDPIGITA